MLSSGEPTVHTPDEPPAGGASPASRIAGEESGVSHVPERSKTPPATGRTPLLRRADQAVVASVVGLALVAVVAYWTLRGGMSGRLIEIEADGVDLPRAPLVAEFTVDLNTADWVELDALPNVGERLARRIVESRAADGPFQTVDDLDRISGIGARTIERLRPYLRVSNAAGEQPRVGRTE